MLICQIQPMYLILEEKKVTPLPRSPLEKGSFLSQDRNGRQGCGGPEQAGAVHPRQPVGVRRGDGDGQGPSPPSHTGCQGQLAPGSWVFYFIFFKPSFNYSFISLSGIIFLLESLPLTLFPALQLFHFCCTAAHSSSSPVPLRAGSGSPAPSPFRSRFSSVPPPRRVGLPRASTLLLEPPDRCCPGCLAFQSLK